MKYVLRTILITLFVLSSPFSAFAAMTPAQLSAQIDAVAKKYPKVTFSAEVRSLSDNKVIYQKNPNALSHPASNVKLLTTIVALDTLGEDFTYETSIYGAKPVAGTVKGDLVLYGRGDPTLLDTDIEALAKQIKDRGITRIEGNIVGDESYLTGSKNPPGRNKIDIQSYYGAEVSALTVYENLVGITLAPGGKIGTAPVVRKIIPTTSAVRIVNKGTTGSSKSKSTFKIERGPTDNIFVITGSIPLGFGANTYYLSIHNPALYAATMLRDALVRHGITATGTVAATETESIKGKRELASVESDPLEKIVEETNKRSNNLFAELLLRTIGKHAAVTGRTDEARGLTAIKAYTSSIGIAENAFTIVDGSGLGLGSFASPAVMNALLMEAVESTYARELVASLPVAGVDGTIANRMKGTIAGGRVQAKTGTLETVDTLSGIVSSSSGNDLVFSFFTTHAPKSAQGRTLIDAASVLLARYATQ